MKKSNLFIVAIFIFLFTSCNINDESDLIIEQRRDNLYSETAENGFDSGSDYNHLAVEFLRSSDLFLENMVGVINHLYKIKLSETNYEDNLEAGYHLMNEDRNDDLFAFMKENFKLTKDQLKEIGIMALNLQEKSGMSNDEFETFLNERLKYLIQEQHLILDMININSFGSRGPCWWIAVSGVAQAALSAAGGCITGPVGCAIGGAYAGLELAGTVMDLCENCGC